MVSDLDKIYSCLARMRNAMVKAHPENLGGSVSDVLECALCLESFQKELLETVAIATSQARILEKKLAANTRECEDKLFIWNARGRLEVLEGIICSLKEGVAADQIIEWARARQAIERPEFDKAMKPSAEEGE